MARAEDFGYGATMTSENASANPAKAVSLQATKTRPSNGTGTPLWQQFFVFLVGFSIQFNVLIGGSGGGVAETGGYGYRFTDFIALSALGLLGLYSLAPQRLFPLGLFGLIVAALFFFPILSSDPRTGILAKHYVLYSLAGIYIATIVSEPSALARFLLGIDFRRACDSTNF